ncbi:VanZ family protein [Paenibacillus sp. YPG26]|uniref:VanZ family protein n=1 Tax=Paenibacillus sp. YPG26 TaxID=2878915 RepID=UPI00203BC62D|nr:VanZ family protein [Paenibacillus sp. YPG26]USB33939.1 VanZ family protein [Paenibacillus sp. YPG26]
MRLKRMSFSMLITAMFAAYLYIVVRVILFKFHSIDMEFITQQLWKHLQSPGLILDQLTVRANFIPFHEIMLYWEKASFHALVNFMGNIVIFIPFGMLLPLVFRRMSNPLSRVLLLSFTFSLGLETAQLILAIGTFDVDDLILNTFGGVLGYGVFLLGSKRVSSSH